MPPTLQPKVWTAATFRSSTSDFFAISQRGMMPPELSAEGATLPINILTRGFTIADIGSRRSIPR